MSGKQSRDFLSARMAALSLSDEQRQTLRMAPPPGRKDSSKRYKEVQGYA